MKFDIKTTLSYAANTVNGYDIQFRSGVRVNKTLHLRESSISNTHLYIGVDRQNIPVCMTLIHPPVSDWFGYPQIASIRESALELFGLAFAMAAVNLTRFTNHYSDFFESVIQRLQRMERSEYQYGSNSNV